MRSDSKKRLAKISGQVSGLQRMVDSDRSCADILQQIVAARAALDQLGIGLLTEHLQTCVLHQGDGEEVESCGDVPESHRSEEIKASIKRFLK